MNIKWTTQEIDRLTELWPHTNASDIIILFPNRTTKGLNLFASRLGLSKTDEIIKIKKIKRSERQSLMNKTIIGRDLSLENLKQIALKYSSKREFAYHDNSAYVTARRLKILDEICSHMLKGLFINWPQTLLLEIIKELYPTEYIKENDRLAIYPKEIDVYVKSKNLGFEYDGKTYHDNNPMDTYKDELCKSKGIDLYRIKEISKSNPLPHILSQLNDHGFNIKNINPNDILDRTIKSMITIEEIKRITSSYDNYKDFKNREGKILNILNKSGKLEEFTSHMKKLRIPVTYNEILSFLTNSKTKKDVISNGRIYNKLIKNKNPELIKIYNELKGNSYKTI